MLNDILQISMILATVLLGVLTVELKDLLYASLSFCGMCITIGNIFWLLNAPHVSVFQLLVYAGAVVILVISVVMLTERKET
jgi:NADH:ubiquinone oxidoreductase subunit 6 (subunit J)